MSTKNERLTFISYSRSDKEFALELARELKEAGFSIWLDQLDIPTGARWDDEIEQALEQCEIFMVILTPSSTASDNVKDEIGYAIDSDKRILPVLLENANLPLRLRRFQYVNFTNISHDEGINLAQQLLQKLLDEPTSPKPPIVPTTGEQPDRTEELRADALRLARQRSEAVRKAREQEQRERNSQIGSQAIPPQKPAAGRPVTAPASPFLSVMIGAPIVLLLCVGGGWMALKTMLPPAVVTALPSATVVLPSPTPIPSETPEASETPKVVETFTTVPTSTFTPIPTATDTPFAPQEPDQFLNFYFETILVRRDYPLAWSLLSDAFKTNNNPAGYEDWKQTWEKVAEWQRPAWTVRYTTASRALVSTAEMQFRGTSWYSLYNREFCVTRDDGRNTWIIDAKANCS